jgi:branched-chain amino acid transport system permease protein
MAVVVDSLVRLVALVMVVVGGFKSVIGPIVGAIVYFLFKDLLGDYATYWMAIFGATLIAVIVFSPDGIAGALERLLKPHAKHGAASGPRGH